jgi:uncharacterized protein
MKKYLFLGFLFLPCLQGMMAFEEIATSFLRICKSSECLSKSTFHKGVSYKVFGNFSSYKENVQEGRKTVRILSIDGGGIRGILPLVVLKEIERKTNKSISEIFDIVSGTSTGGIISLALTAPKSITNNNPLYKAEDLLEKYEEKGSEIFSRKSYFSGYFGPKYDKNKLRRILIELGFKDQLLSDALTSTILPAFSLPALKNRVFFSGSEKNKSPKENFILDVALATSAAPTYFDPHRVYLVDKNKIKRGDPIKEEDLLSGSYYHAAYNKANYDTCIDGGISINNPTLLSYIKAKEIFPEANDFFIISIGTGKPDIDGEDKNKDKGLFGIMKNFHIMNESQSKAIEETLSRLFEQDQQQGGINVRYHRWQVSLDRKHSFLDGNHSIDYLKEKGRELLEQLKNNSYEKTFDKVINELSARRNYQGIEIDTTLEVGRHFSNSKRIPVSVANEIIDLKNNITNLSEDLTRNKKALEDKEGALVDVEKKVAEYKRLVATSEKDLKESKIKYENSISNAQRKLEEESSTHENLMQKTSVEKKTLLDEIEKEKKKVFDLKKILDEKEISIANIQKDLEEVKKRNTKLEEGVFKACKSLKSDFTKSGAIITLETIISEQKDT